MVQETQAYLGAVTEWVTFGNRVKGFLALPERGTPPFPAVVLGHERYGLVQHTLDLTAKLAAYGFAAIAPDMYSRWDGDIEALNRGDITVRIPDPEVTSYMVDAFDFLAEHRQVNSQQIAGMGVCLSGHYPLLLNAARPTAAANIVVYGGAGDHMWEVSDDHPDPYESIIERLTAPVLGIWGEDDFVVSVEDVRRLRGVLEDKRKTYEFKLFAGMPHGWFNSTMPGRFRPRETDQAWLMIMDFLDRANAGAFPRDRALWRFESDIATSYDFTKKVRLA